MIKLRNYVDILALSIEFANVMMLTKMSTTQQETIGNFSVQSIQCDIVYFLL